MGDEYLTKTLRIFSTPSWVSGAARLVDLGGVFDRYKTSRSVRVADAQALKNDWDVVGSALQGAMHQMDRTLGRSR